MLPDGEKGEIIILGDDATRLLSAGGAEQKGVFEQAEGAGVIRGYWRPAIRAIWEKRYAFSERIDLQIKLHGYRIELEDIENNIQQIRELSMRLYCQICAMIR